MSEGLSRICGLSRRAKNTEKFFFRCRYVGQQLAGHEHETPLKIGTFVHMLNHLPGKHQKQFVGMKDMFLQIDGKMTRPTDSCHKHQSFQSVRHTFLGICVERVEQGKVIFEIFHVR